MRVKHITAKEDMRLVFASGDSHIHGWQIMNLDLCSKHRQLNDVACESLE